MGDLFHFPMGGRSNVIRVHRYTTTAGKPLEVVTLSHRRGECVVWQTGDEGALEQVLAVWQSCGVRLSGEAPRATIFTQKVDPDRSSPPPFTPDVELIESIRDDVWPDLVMETKDAADPIFEMVERFPRSVALPAVMRFANRICPKIRDEIRAAYPEFSEHADWLAADAMSAVVARVAGMFDEKDGGHA
ncbi:MAG: hypothetical protein GX458_04580 [Phyllobacteriaceae bacterium]|nr:hypothetical protein [Phyllobacteriaceae bacterium]